MTTTTGPNLNARSMTKTLAEASLYFMGQGALNNTLTQLAEDLKAEASIIFRAGPRGEEREHH